MQSQIQQLEVWGDLACFTRPEMKVERFTYPVITPSAARGIFDAIYWKPTFRWEIIKVEMLTPVKFISLRRNEVKEVGPSENKVLRWSNNGEMPEPIIADLSGGDGTKGRTQRQTIALKDIKYRLHALAKPWQGKETELTSILAQFRRRAERGQCFVQPCFGCREFPAYFRLVPDGEKAAEPLTSVNLDVGFMIYDVFNQSRLGTSTDAPSVSVFRAKVINGVMEIPCYESTDVKKISSSHGGAAC